MMVTCFFWPCGQLFQYQLAFMSDDWLQHYALCGYLNTPAVTSNYVILVISHLQGHLKVKVLHSPVISVVYLIEGGLLINNM